MTVRVYYSTDASAPVWSGTAGSRIAVLKACLVTGYGAKAAAGWAEAFTGTNKSVFRAPIGTRRYFRFDDSYAQAFTWKGYTAMTDVDTGTGMFPASTSVNTGYASPAADATARQWAIVADERTVWVWWQTRDDNLGGQLMSFGEATKLKPTAGDVGTYAWGSGTPNTGAAVTAPGSVGWTTAVALNSPAVALYKVETSAGAADTSSTSTVLQRCVMMQPLEGSVGSNFGQHGYATPLLTSGNWQLSPIAMMSTQAADNYGKLAVFRGIMDIMHLRPFNNWDILTGSGELAGKQYLVVNLGAGAAQSQCLLEISDTWM